MAFIDYKNINHDLLIENGDFVKADCAQDHIEDIMLATKGSYKQFPLVGLNLFQYLNSPFTNETKISFAKQIRLQLEADKYKVRLIDVSDFENIKVEASK